MSVDPLVTMTMEPYIYGSANPVTISDPTGLCGCENFDPIYGGADYVPSATGVPGKPVPAQTRDSIASNPSVLENHLDRCWYYGSACQDILGGDSRFDQDTLDLAQSLLLQFTALGAFVVGDGALQSSHTDNPRGVKFRVVVGSDGTLHVISIQGEPTSFKEMAAGGVGFIGDTASILELGGLAACPFTAGGGCVFAKAAGAVNLGASLVDVGLTCGDARDASCAFSVATTGGEALFMSAAGFMDNLTGLQGAGNFQAGVMWQGSTFALQGAFSVNNDDFGVKQYVLVL